ncbi:uncharacterized protein LOC119268175 isoform X2 [Triticum dicoccoides]|uniref:uncharacterized protein LOC119268175 isoform X2 n=1 Tax=Triticum dicoccoides TaxID=85692 RepID=UPI00188E125C|nr:uncharacterized protein LOC119268175 isoform X2 [Triticum dicoccoides]
MAPPLFSPLASAASSPPPRRRPLPPPPPSLLRHHTVLPASVGVQLTAALAGGRWRPQLMHKLASPWRRSRAAPAPRHPLLPSSAGGLRGHHLGRCCLFHPAGGARGEQQQRGQATSGRVCGGAHIRSFLNPMVSIEPQRGSELEMRWGQKVLLGWFQDREGKDFLLSAGGERAEIRETKQPEETENTTPVLCTGHIPHSFCEDQMQVSFSSLGLLRRGSVLPRTARTYSTEQSRGKKYASSVMTN